MRVLSNRSGRTLALLSCATVVAAGLVLVGAGPLEQAQAAVSPGTTQLVSTDQHALGQDTDFVASGQAAISANGRYVAFSTFTSFDPLDVHREYESDLDVYVRDLQEQRTVLISHGVLPPPRNVLWLDGLPALLAVPADGHSGHPSISADGRYVAFQTTANNLGAPDHDLKSDVVVVDRDPDGNGVFDESNCALKIGYCPQVTRVSPDWFDEQDRPVIEAEAPSISAAGDAVAWVGMSLAGKNRPQGETEHHRKIPVVYRSTLEKAPNGALTGVRSEQVDARAEGLLVRGESAPVLSGDGKRLALIAQTESPPESPSESPSESSSESPSESPSGNDEQRPANSAVLGVDLTAGPLAGTGEEGYPAVRLDIDEDGHPLSVPADFDAAPALSGDGRLVAFTAPGAGSPVVRTVAWEADLDPRSVVVSTDTSGNPVDGRDPALSADGRYLAFTTSARNVHNGVDGPDTTCSAAGSAPPPAPPQAADPAGSHCDVVVRDLGLDRARADAGLPRLPAELASPSLTQSCVAAPALEDTCEGDDASGHPALSADGGVVAYESTAATLTPQDRNGHVQDVFARTFTPSLTADPLDFFTIEPGNSTIGSTTLRHVGFGPLLVESITISGPQATDYSVDPQTCIGTTLHAGQSCPVPVRFTPSGLGLREATLQVQYHGSRSPLVLPLLAIAELNPPRVVTFTPEPLAFGPNLPLSTSPPADVAVQNTGNAPLTISAVGLPTDAGPEQFPADYRIIGENCIGQTLPPGASCVVTVQFSPQGVGERPAVLRFDDNAPNAPHLLALQGTGIQPLLRFDPDIVQVGRVTTLTGSGFAALRNVTIQLPDIAGPITITTDAAGNFSTSVVIFENTRPGERHAEATIDDHQPPITATTTLLIVPRPAPPPGTTRAPR
jgi:hypothetical protein